MTYDNYDEIGKRISSLPSLDEIERMARLQLQDAQRFGVPKGVREAQEVLQHVQQLKTSNTSLPFDKPLGQALQAMLAANQTGQSSGGTSDFDPISYMNQFFTRGPWAGATKTIEERKMEASQAQQDFQNALAEAGVTGIYKGQPTLQRLVTEAGLTGMYRGQPTWQRTVEEANLTGMYQGQPTWQRQYAEQQLAQEMARIAAGRSAAGTGMVSSTDIRNENYGNFLNIFKKQLDEAWAKGGWNAAYALLPALEAQVYQLAPEMRKAGVNPQDIIDYIYKTVGGFVKQGGEWVLAKPSKSQQQNQQQDEEASSPSW